MSKNDRYVVRRGSDRAIKRGRITTADGVFRKQGDAERVAKQTVHNILGDEGRKGATGAGAIRIPWP